MKKYLLPLALLSPLALIACGGVESSEISATGDQPSIRLEAWCEEDSTMYVQVNYGTVEYPLRLVGRDFKEMDWYEDISESFGTSEKFTTTSTLQVFASPNEGTCYVALMDNESEEFIRSVVKRKDVEMTGYVPPIRA